MPVPFIDLATELAPLRGDLDRAIARVLDSGVFIGGDEVAGFERALAAHIGARHAVGASSGTDALLAILMAPEWASIPLVVLSLSLIHISEPTRPN